MCMKLATGILDPTNAWITYHGAGNVGSSTLVIPDIAMGLSFFLTKDFITYCRVKEECVEEPVSRVIGCTARFRIEIILVFDLHPHNDMQIRSYNIVKSPQVNPGTGRLMMPIRGGRPIGILPSLRQREHREKVHKH